MHRSILWALPLALMACAGPELSRTPSAGHERSQTHPTACKACQTAAGHHMPALSAREVAARYRFRVQTDPPTPRAGETTRITVYIEDAQGRPVSTLQVHHDRLAHFLVVSENLEEFHHLHPEDFGLLTPEAEKEARFSFPVTFGMGGRYLLAIDAVDAGRAIHKEIEIQVDGPPQPPTRWDFSNERRVGDLTCRLETSPARIETRNRVEATIAITRGGQPVTDLEPYLGVLTHLAIFRENASASAHTHGGGPEFAHMHAHKAIPGYRGPKLYFGNEFSQPGRYRIFSQFRWAGRVYTVPFDVEVHPPRETR